MKVLHITPSSEGYQEVNLIANRYSRKNQLAVIEYNGQESFTGGVLLNDTPAIREVLNRIPKTEQYNFVKEFKVNPWAKAYLNEYEI